MAELEIKYMIIDDVKVKEYLSYAEIQAIVNEALKYQSWAERQQIIDYYILRYATDIPVNEIDNIDTEKLICSGFMNKVSNCIANYHEIFDAIKYEESVGKQLGMILQTLPSLVKTTLEDYKKKEK